MPKLVFRAHLEFGFQIVFQSCAQLWCQATVYFNFIAAFITFGWFYYFFFLHRIIFKTCASSVRTSKDLHEVQEQEQAEPPDAARGLLGKLVCVQNQTADWQQRCAPREPDACNKYRKINVSWDPQPNLRLLVVPSDLLPPSPASY